MVYSSNSSFFHDSPKREGVLEVVSRAVCTQNVPTFHRTSSNVHAALMGGAFDTSVSPCTEWKGEKLFRQLRPTDGGVSKSVEQNPKFNIFCYFSLRRELGLFARFTSSCSVFCRFVYSWLVVSVDSCESLAKVSSFVVVCNTECSGPY